MVIGGGGLIASKLVTKPGALVDEAAVVVDVSDSPSIEGASVLEFFETSIAYFGDVEHSFRLMPKARFDAVESTSGAA